MPVQRIPNGSCQRPAVHFRREKKILSEAQIKDLLDPVKLSGLDKSKYKKN